MRLVPAQRRRAPRAPFVVLIIAMLGGALLCVLVLNTQRAQDAFTLTSLQKHNAQLSDQMQMLRAEVQKDQTPSTIASRATAIGMVPGGNPAFVDQTGKILGVGATGVVSFESGQRFGDILVTGKATIRKPVAVVTPVVPATTPTSTTTTAPNTATTTTPNAKPNTTPVAPTVVPTPTAGAQ